VRLALASLWILIGGAIAGGLYWGFLITPVSTVLALITSALLAIAVLAMIGVTANGAIAILTSGFSMTGLRRALASVGSIIPAGLIVLVLWWLSSRAELSAAQNSGPINAWFIARFGWDDVSGLFTTIRYVAMWFRWVLGAVLALSVMTLMLESGWSAMVTPAWITRALRPRVLLIATLSLVILIALPWRYLVPWRPEGLPATSIEMVFIVTKLAVAAILAALAVALIAREAGEAISHPSSSSPPQ
jgi:hypothetical protein